MEVKFKNYVGDRTGNGDFESVHRFLVKNQFSDYTYGRFDWMMTNWDYLEDRYLTRIGIWRAGGDIVGICLFDHSLDVIFPLVQEGFESLYGEMLEYARTNMVKEAEPDFLIYAGDGNAPLKNEMVNRGFFATDWKEKTAIFDCSKEIPESNLPEGYAFTSLQDEDAFEKYYYCLFRGFDHEQEGMTFSFDHERDLLVRAAYSRSFVDLSLKLSVKNPEGDYVAHCGMWYDPNSKLALIEPVCVIPACRRMGLGRDVVREGLRRVKALGAGYALVGSDQAFYYSLGMVPYTEGTLWKPGL